MKGFWLSALNATGEIFNQFPMKVILLDKESVDLKVLVQMK